MKLTQKKISLLVLVFAELIRLIAENPEKRDQIVALWKQQFPKDVEKFGL